MAECPYVYDVGVGWVDDDARRARGPDLQGHALPMFSTVGGLIDTRAQRDIGADVGLARSRPHDLVVGGRDGQGPDGVVFLVVEDGSPVLPAVVRFPDAARCGTGIVGERVSRDSHHRRNPVPHWADVAVAEVGELVCGDLLRGGRRWESDDQGERGNDHGYQTGCTDECRHRDDPCYTVLSRQQWKRGRISNSRPGRRLARFVED